MTTPPPRDIEDLEERLSRPTEAAVAAMASAPPDLLLLGAGGKMGPTLARMAVRASQQAQVPTRIHAASRFTDPAVRQRLESCGVRTIACDLLDESQLARLPSAPWVLHMTGFKFGAERDPTQAWAMNCLLPALVCRRFATSTIVAFSTGNVYPLSAPESGGCRESDPVGPRGEYAMTALGRERLFQYFSQRQAQPLTLLRLNYAVEMRYGVLLDLAWQVRRGQPIELTMGFVNVIWQGDANAAALAAFSVAQPQGGCILNVAGPEILRVRDVAQKFGELLGCPPCWKGVEGPTALLNNGQAARRLWGPPQVDAATLMRWTAAWVAQDLPTLNKPTHFQVRNGRF